MTAHVVYTAWDKDQPGSLSATVIGGIIRGQIGFDGLLMSDDLGMHALKGSFTDRAAGVIAAGCDIALHCSGDMDEMQACAKGVSGIASQSRERLDAAMATIAGGANGASFEDLIARRDSLLALPTEA
jgi:beta-N-acetylhexosaminidase